MSLYPKSWLIDKIFGSVSLKFALVSIVFVHLISFTMRMRTTVFNLWTTWTQRERRDVRFSPIHSILTFLRVTTKVRSANAIISVFLCIRLSKTLGPSPVVVAAVYINLLRFSFVFLSSLSTSMAGTYTHKFDSPSYKGDVTINTGCVLFFWTGWRFWLDVIDCS